MSTNFQNLQMTRATTLEGLKTGETKLVWSDDDPAKCCNVWAPEMHYIDGAWHIYYSAGANPLGEQHSHVIRGGATPWDTYDYAGQIRPNGEWAIDGTILTINNQNYFVYSGFFGGFFEDGGKQSLFIAPMTSATTSGEAKVLSIPTQAWETVGNPVNEGAYALYNGNNTYIAFSASFCHTASYQLGLLTYNGGDPMESSSWTKTGPSFSSANGQFGTGHNAFFKSPDGTETWNVYHSTPVSSGNCGFERRANAAIVQWNDDGSPNFGLAPPYGEVLPGPSGE